MSAPGGGEREFGFSPEAESRLELLGVWCAIGYIVLLLGGWGLVAGFIPPVHPNAGEKEIADLFREDHTRIRIGMVLIMFGALVFIPFGAVFTRFISKVEGRTGIVTYTALLGAVGTMILTFYPAMAWLTAAYRPDREPAVTYLFSDYAWLQFVGGATVIMAMPIAVTLAAFLDRRPDPVFPRWAGYLNIWIVLLTIPDQLLFFFTSGPFSWNGIIGLWIPVTAFGLWFLVTFWLLRRAVLRERGSLVVAAA